MSETKDVLTSALEALERDGWCQRAIHDPDGSHCTLGAIERGVQAQPWYVRTDTERALSAYHGAAARIRKIVRMDGTPQGVAKWNDDPKTTYEDVVRTFKRAIHDD